MTMDIGERELRAAINLMNDLVVVNRGIIGVYEAAAESLKDDINRRLMSESAAKHERFIAELSYMIYRYNGNPVSSTYLGSIARRTWINVKSAVSDGDGPILAEVAAEAKKVLNAYAEAMSVDLPDDIHNLVRSHTSEVRIICEKLLPLSAAYDN